MNLLLSFKPGVPKRFLLFIAGFVWTFAGGMLLFKGMNLVLENTDFQWIELLICSLCGTLFYIFLFSRISNKHTHRILGLTIDRPCLFSFFNLGSYIIMMVMISGGILLRKFDIISHTYLSYLYLTMGIPLFISAFRFYYFGFYYYKIK